eukprot:g9659.t1
MPLLARKVFCSLAIVAGWTLNLMPAAVDAKRGAKVYRKKNENTFRLLYVPEAGRVVQKSMPKAAPEAVFSKLVDVVDGSGCSSASAAENKKFLQVVDKKSRGGDVDQLCDVLSGLAVAPSPKETPATSAAEVRVQVGEDEVGKAAGPAKMELQTYFNDQVKQERPITKPIDKENLHGLYAFATPEPFLYQKDVEDGVTKKTTSQNMNEMAARFYFPAERDLLKEFLITALILIFLCILSSIARHTVELGAQSYVMHWWSKSEKSLQKNSTGGLTRFELLPTSFSDNTRGPSVWVGMKGSAVPLATAKQQLDEGASGGSSTPKQLGAGSASPIQTLDEMKTALPAGTGLHRLDLVQLKTQAAVMQQAVAQNFNRVVTEDEPMTSQEVQPLTAQEVPLTLWWSERVGVAGLWIVGTLKELREKLTEDDLGAEKYRNELNVDKVEVVAENEDGAETLVLIQKAEEGADHAAAAVDKQKVALKHRYDAEDATQYVLYAAGTGAKKVLMAMKCADFLKESELLEEEEAF